MKAVTLHLDEDIYSRYQALARMRRQTASELIRQAMAEFPLAQKPSKASLIDSPPPKTVGKIYHSWTGRQDLLEDFFDRS